MLTVVVGGRGVKDNMMPAQVTYQLPYRLTFLVKVDFGFYYCEKLGQVLPHFLKYSKY